MLPAGLAASIHEDAAHLDVDLDGAAEPFGAKLAHDPTWIGVRTEGRAAHDGWALGAFAATQGAAALLVLVAFAFGSGSTSGAAANGVWARLFRAVVRHFRLFGFSGFRVVSDARRRRRRQGAVFSAIGAVLRQTTADARIDGRAKSGPGRAIQRRARAARRGHPRARRRRSSK